MTSETRKHALDQMPDFVGTPGTSAYERSVNAAARWYYNYYATIRHALSQPVIDTTKYKVVPLEPTDEMLAQAVKGLTTKGRPLWVILADNDHTALDLVNPYKAMISAAPEQGRSDDQ